MIVNKIDICSACRLFFEILHETLDRILSKNFKRFARRKKKQDPINAFNTERSIEIYTRFFKKNPDF